MSSMREKYGWVMDALTNASLATKAAALKQFLRGKKRYLPTKDGNADMDAVIKCALCPNMCKFDCPLLAAAQNDATSPSGKARIAYFLETDRLDSEDAIDLMYACCNCDACREWCPFAFSAADILRGVRADLAEQEHVPPGAAERHRQLMDERVLYPDRLTIDAPARGDTLYFMGCEVAAHHPEIAEATMALLADSYAMLPEEWCCGAPLYNLGFWDTFEEFARHNAAAIAETGCSDLICSCPTCTHMFREVYPSFGVDIEAEVHHSTEYLLQHLDIEAFLLDSLDAACVYHDPCTLARTLGVTEAPRELLRRAGVDIAEAYYAGRETQCCGRGGSLAATHRTISEAITKRRIEELRKAGERIVTACPTCKSAFVDAGADAKDVTELLWETRERA